MPLRDLAREASMAPAKVHPYMVSLQQANPIQVAIPLIAQLTKRSGHTVALAVWGDRSATIVRLEESPAAVHINMC